MGEMPLEAKGRNSRRQWLIGLTRYGNLGGSHARKAIATNKVAARILKTGTI
jgi:hypothetical protein